MSKWIKRVGWAILVLCSMITAFIIVITCSDAYVSYMHWPYWSIIPLVLVMMPPLVFLIAAIVSYTIHIGGKHE